MANRKKGHRLLITAGPTWEQVDPVRYISNRSTGVLGYLLAEAATRRGHQVTLISGPSGQLLPKKVKRVSVETADQMGKAVTKYFRKADALIMSAAVADFRPVRVATRKIERSGAAGALQTMNLKLVENPDILATISAISPADAEFMTCKP